ncbi:hypothetical protein YYG_05085 [Plasmodium vinckei petteri]|uniref:Fam-a protein n=1 Tax=Plasmodium vinckei petteri TaxID=138298 RepID=W7A904_PLAVN|nr:hypothetical protein YYG_05085 [Plasmodium vinckei petteri]
MNKGYIKIVLFVLSLFVFANNTTFADNNAIGKINPNNTPTNNTTPDNTTPNSATPDNIAPKKKSSKKKSSKKKSSKKKPSKKKNPKKAPPKKLKPSDINFGEIFSGIYKHFYELYTDEQNDTPAKSDEQNDTPAKSDEQNATPTKSDGQNDTPTKSDEQNDTPIKSAKRKATPIKSAKRKATPIKSAERKATPIKSAEQNGTLIKTAEQYAASIELARQYATPIKLPEQNATPTKSAKRKATPTKSAEQYVTLPEISLPEISLSEIALRITNLNNESSNESLLKKPGSEMRYKLHKHLLCLDPEETEKAIKHVSEAVALLLKLGSDTDSYKVEFRKDNRTFIYSKKLENIDIAKFNTKTQGSNKYDEIINVLWDSNGTNQFDVGVINGNVARVYNPNLLMMKKSSDPFSVVLPSKITYSFATKVEISDDTTVILCPSININYLNEDIGDTDMLELLENVKPIETDINVKEALTKMADNISGFIIKKNQDSVDLTYINSIYNNDSSFLESFRNKRDRAKKYVYIMGSHTIMQ